MSEQDLENWMNATDEERQKVHAGWDVANKEGKEIAQSIANLLVKECVYDVTNVAPINADGEWQIQAYADSDYGSLKDRNIDFLGFKLALKKTA